MSDTPSYKSYDSNDGLVDDFATHRFDDDSADNEVDVHCYPRYMLPNANRGRSDSRSYDFISNVYGGSFAETLFSMNIGDNVTPELIPLIRKSQSVIMHSDPPPQPKYASEIPYSERYYRNLIIEEEREVFTEVISGDLLLFRISDSMRQIQLREETWRNRIDVSENEEFSHYIFRPFINYFLRLIQSGNPVSLIGALMEKIRIRQLEMQSQGETFLSMPSSPMSLIAAEIRKFRSSTNVFPHGSEPISRALIMYHERLRRYDCAFMFVSCKLTWEEEWSRLMIEICRGFTLKSLQTVFSVIQTEQSMWEELLYIAEPFLTDMKEHNEAMSLHFKRFANKKMWQATIKQREKQRRVMLISNRDEFILFSKDKKLRVIHEMQQNHINMAMKAINESLAVQGNIDNVTTAPAMEPFIMLLEGGSLLEVSKTAAGSISTADREFDEIYHREGGAPISLPQHVMSHVPPKDIISLLTIRYRNDMTYLSDLSVPNSVLDQYYCRLQALDRRLRELKSDYYTSIEDKMQRVTEGFKKRDNIAKEENNNTLLSVTSQRLRNVLPSSISLEPRGTYEHSVHYQELLNKRRQTKKELSNVPDPLLVQGVHTDGTDRYGHDIPLSTESSSITPESVLKVVDYHHRQTDKVVDVPLHSFPKHLLDNRATKCLNESHQVFSKWMDSYHYNPSPINQMESRGDAEQSKCLSMRQANNNPEIVSCRPILPSGGNESVYKSLHTRRVQQRSSAPNVMSQLDQFNGSPITTPIPFDSAQEGASPRQRNPSNNVSLKREISISGSPRGGPMKVKLTTVSNAVYN